MCLVLYKNMTWLLSVHTRPLQTSAGHFVHRTHSFPTRGVFCADSNLTGMQSRDKSTPKSTHVLCACIIKTGSFIQLVVEFYEIKITLFLAVRVTRLN